MITIWRTYDFRKLGVFCSGRIGMICSGTFYEEFCIPEASSRNSVTASATPFSTSGTAEFDCLLPWYINIDLAFVYEYVSQYRRN